MSACLQQQSTGVDAERVPRVKGRVFERAGVVLVHEVGEGLDRRVLRVEVRHGLACHPGVLRERGEGSPVLSAGEVGRVVALKTARRCRRLDVGRSAGAGNETGRPRLLSGQALGLVVGLSQRRRHGVDDLQPRVALMAAISRAGCVGVGRRLIEIRHLVHSCRLDERDLRRGATLRAQRVGGVEDVGVLWQARNAERFADNRNFGRGEDGKERLLNQRRDLNRHHPVRHQRLGLGDGEPGIGLVVLVDEMDLVAGDPAGCVGRLHPGEIAVRDQGLGFPGRSGAAADDPDLDRVQAPQRRLAWIAPRRGRHRRPARRSCDERQQPSQAVLRGNFGSPSSLCPSGLLGPCEPINLSASSQLDF